MTVLEHVDITEEIKRIIVRSIYSNDSLFDTFVLKGGNAIALIHNKKARKSVDVDFSISGDFPGGFDGLKEPLEQSLIQGFNESNYHLFDFKLKETPKQISEDMKFFWGGYSADFKIISFNKLRELAREIEAAPSQKLEIIRRNALAIHGSTKIEIDISKHECVSSKIEKEIDGIFVYAYSVEMIAAEKLRAICQQHPTYGEIIKRNRAGSSRPRDFFDIHLLVTECNIDLLHPDNLLIIKEMFNIKRVPLSLLGQMEDQRSFHGSNFTAVTSTLEVELNPEHDFDFYFDFVNNLAKEVHNALG